MSALTAVTTVRAVMSAQRHCVWWRSGVHLALAHLALLSVAGAQVSLEWTKMQSPAYPLSNYWADGLCHADVNGDGFDDLFVLETQATVQGQPTAGKAWLLYGPTLDTWLEIESADPAATERMGWVAIPGGPGPEGCSVGDVDGDGVVDLLIGSPLYSSLSPLLGAVGRAHLFFGPDYTREVIFNDPTPESGSYFGASVLLADLTGDGRSDVVIGAPGTTVPGPANESIDEVGEVWFWDATELETPQLILNPLPGFKARFGSSVDAIDLAGDDQPELLVGAPLHSVCCPQTWGAVHVFDGRSLAYQQTILPPIVPQVAVLNFGDVIHYGDLTGDGVPDLVVSAWNSFAQCQSAGVVFVLQGPTFETPAFILTSPKACESGFSGAFGRDTEVVDIDRDGAMDIVVGDAGKPWGEQRTWIFFGPDFQTVQELGDDFQFTAVAFGIELETGDFDGDGWQELAVAASEGGATGSLYFYNVQTLQADASMLSVASGNTVTFTLDGSVAQAGNAYLAALSVSGPLPGLVPAPGVFLPLNVDAVTFIGLSLINGPLLPGFAGALDSQGQASFQMVLPPGVPSGLVGETLTVAAVIATPRGTILMGSSAVALVLAP